MQIYNCSQPAVTDDAGPIVSWLQVKMGFQSDDWMCWRSLFSTLLRPVPLACRAIPGANLQLTDPREFVRVTITKASLVLGLRSSTQTALCIFRCAHLNYQVAVLEAGTRYFEPWID